MRINEIIQSNLRGWFGNSKVVDQHGKPLVVYHGTRSDFTDFDDQYGNDLGFHFGSQEQANSFTRPEGSYVRPVYLKIENPLRLPDLGRFVPETMMSTLTKMGIEVPEVPYTAKTGDVWHNMEEWGRQKMQAVKKAIQQAGYDGIVYDNAHEGSGDSWIAFEPQQIRSAL